MHLAGYEDGALFDEDADVRRELVYDLERVAALAGGFDVLLLGGDIAGQGTAREFEKAAIWIDGLIDHFGISADRVFCVPGNHDVDWSTVRGDAVIGTLQESLLNAPLDEVNGRLAGLLNAGPSRGLLMRPLEAYNEFAVRYGCDLQPDMHRWQQSLPLGDLTAQLTGLSSALVSGPGDARKAEDSRLVLGPQANGVGRFADTFSIVLCHHPLPWLRDADRVKRFIERGHLQLFGHEHMFDVMRCGAGVRVHAGALHPARAAQEKWEPSYNVFRLTAPDQPGGQVAVDIWPRGLLEDGTFGPLDENKVCWHFDIDLFSPKASTSVPPVAVPAADPSAPAPAALVEAGEDGDDEVAAAPPPTPAAVREAARVFASLSVEQRLLLGWRFGLLGEDDQALDETARGRLVFHRASEQARLEELLKEMHGHD